MQKSTRAVLLARHLHYGAILRDVSLSVYPGEMVALIGPNGAGKSTLLKLLARVLSPERGDVAVCNQPMARMRARERARWIGYLPQDTQLDVAFSVADIVDMGFYARGQHRSRDEMERILHTVGLGALRDRDVRILSGGERQRAFLGKVLAQDPRVLLLDEPVSGLDLGYQLDMLELCRSLTGEGKTILITLHDMEQALRFADRAILLYQGQVVSEGIVRGVLTDPVMEKAFGVRCEPFIDPVSGHDRLSILRDWTITNL